MGLKQNYKEIAREIDEKSELLKRSVVDSKNLLIDLPLGKTYYISTLGDDNNDGLSPQKPWKTIDRLNEAEIPEGSVVLFKRGDVWRSKTVYCKPGVTYSAYGEGKKPLFLGSPENGAVESKWSLLEGTQNIWVYDREFCDLGCILFDEGKAYGYKETPDFINGEFYVGGSNGEKKFSVLTDLSRNFSFFCDYIPKTEVEGKIYRPTADNVGKVYLRCDEGNPGKIYSSIEFFTKPNLFVLMSNKNITIDNLCIKYTGGHAISAYNNADNLTVSNCEIGWIGGSIQAYGIFGRTNTAIRYGNAVEVFLNVKNYKVYNNYIYQCYDAGVTHQGGSQYENIHYYDNLIEYCCYGIEYFMGGDKDAVKLQKDVLFENNIIRYSGAGFGIQRPDPYSAAIRTNNGDNNSENFVIRNNILDRCTNYMFLIYAKNRESLPQMYDNTVVFNSDAHMGKITDCENLVFDMAKDEHIDLVLKRSGANLYLI